MLPDVHAMKYEMTRRNHGPNNSVNSILEQLQILYSHSLIFFRLVPTEEGNLFLCGENESKSLRRSYATNIFDFT